MSVPNVSPRRQPSARPPSQPDLRLDAWEGQDEPLSVMEGELELPPIPERILIAEDDEAIRKLYRVMLERRGFEVVEAPDGEQAAWYARSMPFDLVIADLNMPRVDGWGLLAQLRQDCRTRDLPVAFLSNQEDLRESLRAQQVGAQAYISKGTRLELIAQEVLLLCEPGRRLRRLLRTELTEPVMAAGVGAVALLREIHQARWTGSLKVIGSWAQVELWFEGGRPVSAVARSGAHTARGVTAFNAFVSCDRFDGLLDRSARATDRNLDAPMMELLEQAIRIVNLHFTKARERLLVKPRQVAPNEPLYRLYSKLSSEGARETARLLCEERLTPAQILEVSDRSPVEIEEELHELLRRGLVELRG